MWCKSKETQKLPMLREQATEGTQVQVPARELHSNVTIGNIMEATPSGTSKKFKGKEKAKIYHPAQKFNYSIQDMDQKEIYFRSYGMLETYATEAGLLNVPGQMWHRLAVLEESTSMSMDGFSA
uniref:Uncharacterized protein n=1 Tax=Cannabis sativa TaxID=3483 RepID=A0A803NL74_CANSA